MIEIHGDAQPEPHYRSGPSVPIQLDPTGPVYVSDACRCGWARTWMTQGAEPATDAMAAAEEGWRRHVADL